MEKALGSYSLSLSPDMTNGHVEYKVPIPKGLVRLHIDYVVGKIWEEDPRLIEGEWRRYVASHPTYREHPGEDEGIRNLVTVSVSSPSRYFGASHRFMEQEAITIGNDHSSPGFIHGDLESGMWRISFNCHAVVTEKLVVDCRIYGEFDEVESNKVAFNVRLPQKEKKKRPIRDLSKISGHKIELHTHTCHSDAVFSTQELVDAAETENIEYLAITDHNTMAPFYDKLAVELSLIYGMELTTFFGHILLHKGEFFEGVDWTEISEQRIDQVLADFKKQGLFIGMAHPFSMGTPYCTGCQWNYVLTNLESLDYIEVWNSFGPHLEPCNLDAFAKWTQLLDQGVQIPATCGRDWHGVERQKAPSSLYVQCEADASPQAVLEAVAMGQSYVTVGPRLKVVVNELYSIGDCLPRGEIQLVLSVENDGGERGAIYVVESNEGVLATGDVSEVMSIPLEVPGACRYMRLSLFNEAGLRVAFTNPFYFD